MTSSRPRRFFVLAAVVVLAAAAGCTSGGDEAIGAPGALPAADDDGTAAAEATTSTSLGDPGAIDGFAPVEDVENDPIESTGSEPVDLTAEAPDAVIEQVADEVGSAADGEELLDTVEPLDRAEAPAGRPDGRPRNGVGEPVLLDEAASLACGQIEIAIGQIDAGLPGVATEFIVAGAAEAGSSAIDDISGWSDPLLGVVEGGSIGDPAPLVGFLSVCTEGGYEL